MYLHRVKSKVTVIGKQTLSGNRRMNSNRFMKMCLRITMTFGCHYSKRTKRITGSKFRINKWYSQANCFRRTWSLVNGNPNTSNSFKTSRYTIFYVLDSFESLRCSMTPYSMNTVVWTNAFSRKSSILNLPSNPTSLVSVFKSVRRKLSFSPRRMKYLRNGRDRLLCLGIISWNDTPYYLNSLKNTDWWPRSRSQNHFKHHLLTRV